MKNSIVFKKANNFWIDNGLIGLFKILQRLKKEMLIGGTDEEVIDYNFSLNSDTLRIELINPKNSDDDDKIYLHPDLIKVLNTAKGEVVKTYLTATNSAGWLFRDGIFEVYRKNDFKMHLKSFFTGKTPKTEGGLCIPYEKEEIEKNLIKNNISFRREKDNAIILNNRFFQQYREKKEGDKKEVAVPSMKKEDVKASDRLMTEHEFISFLDFIENYSLLSIEGAKPTTLTGRGFINTQPMHEIGEEFSNMVLEAGNKLCSFSGKKVKYADIITGMDYPFMTGKSGELNFASNLETKPIISAEYAFIGLFAFYQLYYQSHDKISHYFILYDTHLNELSNFYNSISIDLSQLKNSNYCNFETYMYNLEMEYENLFSFTISTYKQLNANLGRDKRKKTYTKSIFTFTNDGNIFRDVKEYTSLYTLFDLFDAFDESDDEKLNFEHFLNLVRFFFKKIPSSKGDKYDTTWRNRLCSDILNFRSISKIIEWYLAEVKLKEEKASGISYLDKIISIYINKTQIDMDKEMIKKCKSIGSTIGIYSQREDDKSVLFSLRNARNRIEFLKTLSFIQFRVASSDKIEEQFKLRIYDEFFEGLPDSPQWEEYKALVSIFAMNSFLYKPELKSN